MIEEFKIKLIEQKINDIIELLGNYPEAAKKVDQKAWDHLSVYIPNYNSLLEDSEELSALHSAGVDNWEGYGDAMKELHGDGDDEEDGDDE